MKYLSLSVFLLLFLLSSCATRSQTGAVGGAAAGALVGQAIGHNTGATLVGAAVGTMLGSIVGNEMDKYDREQLNHSYERGISGQGSSWVNPESGNQYTVVPESAYQEPASQRVCRRAKIDAFIKGKPQIVNTTACRGKNGQWELQ